MKIYPFPESRALGLNFSDQKICATLTPLSMNEQHLQAYFDLTQLLLNCPSDSEIREVLTVNQQLVDADFFQKVSEWVRILIQRNKFEQANRLMNIQKLLWEEYHDSVSNVALQRYFAFLREILQAIAQSKSNGDLQIIYPLLENNTDKLDEKLAKILRQWGASTLIEAKSMALLGNIISQFSWGNKASNMEIAITAYEVALKVYTHEAFPQQWAMTQYYLATAYVERILGEKAENIEVAIAACFAALTVKTREAFPQDWARTQHNLASAYGKRIRGEKAENIEIAIAAYSAAMSVRTREAFPQDWADTQYNLGLVYGGRIKGEKAENIEQAIAAYSAALTVKTREAFPQDWADTQYNLANAYRERIRGDKAENIEIAIAAYSAALTVITQQAFPQDWASTQNNLGVAYRERIRGEKAENIEIAIAAYTDAMSVRTREAFPQDWARTQHNLATAYRERIRGEKAENIEIAIAAFSAALSVYTQQAFPQEWAMTQYNLANAYRERIRGDKAENIEIAIAACFAAMSVYTPEAFPQDWALTQNNLATAYRERIRGEKAENIEIAIAAFSAALSVYTQQAFPQDWARTQNNLAAAYGERIIGDKAKNIEIAIAAYSDAMSVYTQQAFPQDWAMTQNNLGVAYDNRILGEKAKNIEQAIAAYSAALTVYTREAFPQYWADTQNNLAIAYSLRIRGEKAENIEIAIAACFAALTVYTPEAFPQSWAKTQNNLATAYSERIIGEKAENIERAIAAFSAAMSVYTREAFPQDWAMTQNNLATAYRARILGEKAENIERAIACYQETLKVYTFDAFPQDHATTLWSLGMTYQNTKEFTLAYNTFESAIATAEYLRSEIVSGEESKRKQAEYFNQVYSRMVQVCLELGNIIQAIEYVERSKTRNLVEQILESDSKTIFLPEVVTQLETYRDELATGQNQIQNGNAENPKVLAQRLHELRQQRNELQNRYLPVGFGFKFDSFQVTLDERTAIIEWYILLDDKILAFIVTKKGGVTVWQSQPENLKALIDWGNQYLQNYYHQKDQWQNSLGEELKKLASILHIDEILTHIPNHCDQLILIPHRFLHLFPLHALPVSQNSENSPCLLNLYPGSVSYAPSCQLLQQVQKRQRPDFQSLFAIQNPTEDLYFTDLEVESILSYFPEHQVLSKKQATKAAITQAATQLKQANYLHFSCHGSFNLISTQYSYLRLAESMDTNNHLDLSKCLTLGNLFERNFELNQCRLVVLSACETGLVDFANTSDEYISLPSGFLYAGSASVVSSLWTVNDLSTAFLMIKFYQNLSANLSVTLALQQAQDWLRNVTKKQLEQWVTEENLLKNPTTKIQLRRRLYSLADDAQPFENPFYWAAFCAIGK